VRGKIKRFAILQRVVMIVLLLEILSQRDILIFTNSRDPLRILAIAWSWPRCYDRY